VDDAGKIKSGLFIAILLLNLCLTGTARAVAATVENSWYGIYLKGQKIGWSHTVVSRADSGIAVQDISRLEFSMLGKPESVETRMLSLSGDSLELKHFTFSLSGRETRFRVEGLAQDTCLLLSVEMGGETRADTLSFSSLPQLPSTVGLLFAREAVAEGRKFSAVVFDPSSLAAQELEAEVAGREPIVWGEGEVIAWRIHQDLGGVRVDSWLDDQGQLLREHSGMGYQVEREDSARALANVGTSVRPDIQRLVAVTPDREIPTPRQLTSLSLELDGLDCDSLDLDSGPQKAVGTRVTITVNPASGATPDTLSAETEQSWLAPSEFILSDHPKVKALLPAVCDTTAAPVERLRSILAWMQRNVTASPTFSLPNTLEVLESRKGDCNEFAVLFASLARAAGVPTRIAMGLIYLDGAFYYHAWCESRLGHAWVAVDPVFNQLPADAAHLRLIAGEMERQVEILPLIGNLKIKVLDWKAGEN